MALSPYLKPSVLNGGLYGNSGMANSYTGAYNGGDKSFDKRTTSNSKASVLGLIKDAKTVSEMLTNALGSRSPYYMIGEIQGTGVGRFAARYMQNALGNIVRAVTSEIDAFTGDGQTGVVIDGFGSVSGKIDVDFSKNPVVFVGGSVTDNRVRNPNTVSMTVYVSNLYNDNGLGAAVDYLTGFDPTGITKEAVNVLSNGGNTRAQTALYKLRGLQETGKPFTVYTPHGIYENMLIKALNPKTTAENVDMLECEITFQEVIMYEPYFKGKNQKLPMRTNIIDSDNATVWSSLKGSNISNKISQYSKVLGL